MKKKEKKAVIRTCLDILPVRSWEPSVGAFLLADGSYLDLLRLIPRDLQNIAEDELELEIYQFTKVLKTVGCDLKFLSMRFPLSLERQKAVLLHHARQAGDETRIRWLERQIRELEVAETNISSQHFYLAYCNALGGCRKSYEAIAALAGCSVATAVKAVRELSEAGYLTVKHTKYHSGKLGRTVYGKNTYTVDLALLKKGYTILDRAVLEQELTDSALIVLCAIIVCAGNSSRAFPSISALQKKTGAARSTVCAGLRLLKALKTLLVQLCIKKNQEHSRNSYHICKAAEGNYAAASCDQHIAASDACQAPIEGFSLMGVVRFLANKVKTQITGVLNYLLKERSYRLT